MTRDKKLKLNAIAGLLKQVITVICGFILPRFILQSYGSDVNGLLSSVSQFLGFIGFLDMGIGPVIQSNLYKPLAEKNDEEISKILRSCTKFFRTLAKIFAVYIIALLFIYPVFIDKTFDFYFTVSLILILSISSMAEYLFGISYQLLLNADQLAYVQLSIQSIAIILNTIICIVMMKFGASIQAVKLVSALIYLIRPIGLMIYVKKHYNINYHITYDVEPIKQKWNGFAQHLAGVIVANTDVMVLTVFSSLSNVSVYAVYYMVVRGVSDIIMTTVTGLEALWGNMIAKGESEELIKSYDKTEWLMHSLTTLIFTVAAMLIVSFIKVYTKGITDANYEAPLFAAVLVAAYGMQCIRVPYFRLIKAAGHYKETQNGSFIQMTLNLVVSIVLVKKYGLIGVAIGTFFAMAFHTIYFAVYNSKHIINRPLKFFLKNMMFDVVLCGEIVLTTAWIKLTNISYFSWFIMACKVFGIACIVCIILNLLFNRVKTIELLKGMTRS